MTARTRFIGGVLAAVVYGLVLLLFFEPGVQQDSAQELVARSDTAREFLVADLLFPFIYGLLVPLAALSYARVGGRAPLWAMAAAAAAGLAALFDLAENTLLLAALDTPSPSRVDAAHALAIPKLICFALGALGMLVLLVRAFRTREPAG